MITRRQFTKGASALAFLGLASCQLGKTPDLKALIKTAKGYGKLIPDPDNILDLPAGFSYQVISQLGDIMNDNLPVPDRADGMGCLALDNNRVALVRNHELSHKYMDSLAEPLRNHKSPLAYDQFENGVALPGGTSNIVFNLNTKQREQEFLSLTGTIRNCSGGITPWGTWLTCEESTAKAGELGISEDHGYIFEIPANASGQVQPKPLKAMGRFNHEAAAVDPETGIVYLTEDRDDSLLYRFIPNQFGKLEQGGQLQALVVKSQSQFDTRNWSEPTMTLDTWYDVEWIDINNPESPEDDLRIQGYEAGAALFARGEGIHWGEREVYFCCTSGGQKQLGQIMRYQPSAFEGKVLERQQPGRIQLFVESADESLYNFGDNLTVTPQGHLLVCEDQYTDVVNNHLRGVTPKGELYNFARLHTQTELAGACFSPDGSTLFVNVYSPTKTLAITGPWEDFV